MTAVLPLTVSVCNACGKAHWVDFRDWRPVCRKCCLAVWAFGREVMTGDGLLQCLPPIERPGVNPDRHARIRTRHFFTARENLVWHACGRSHSGSQLVVVDPTDAMCQLGFGYLAAIYNCHWGCP